MGMAIRFAGLLATVAIGLGACGKTESGSISSATDGAAQDSATPGGSSGQAGTTAGQGGIGGGGAGGASGGIGGRSSSVSVADGGIDVPVVDAASDGNACGRNPAEVTCQTSKGQCVPSSCACTSGGWVCTADCRSGLPLCADAGIESGDGGASGVACGNAFCASGEYCCNANCGLCARSGAMCIQVACNPPASWVCKSDSDCQLKSDYCDGCNCRVLGVGGSLATCTSATVQCLVDPCANKLAMCRFGQCAQVAPP